jgi:hypothetical protein
MRVAIPLILLAKIAIVASDIQKFSGLETGGESVTYVYRDEFGKFSAFNQELASGEQYLASGSYSLNVSNSGWNFLNIESTDRGDYFTSMKALGFLEGYLTCNDVVVFYPNFYADTFGSDPIPQEVTDFITENYDWVSEQASQSIFGTEREYWLSIKGLLAQMDGFIQGFSSSPCATQNSFSLMQLLYMNAWGDLYTIQTKFLLANASSSFLEARRRGERWTRLGYPMRTEIPKDLRCSALFRLLPDFSDILFSHVTWDGFSSLYPRIFKHYKIPSIADSGSKHRDLYFSSSPALLSSVDDFYITYTSEDDSAQLVVIETTNELYDPALFKLVVPTSVLSWMRVISSNLLSKNGKQWSETFSMYHSGTYTNQWMILDMNEFVPGNKNPSPGLFTVLEEIPGYIHTEDMSSTLYDQQFWSSYNIPYFPSTYDLSGNNAVCKIGLKLNNNSDNCYNSAPRAKIFNQQYSTVSDITSMQYMINYNEWQSDPNSADDPCKAIACRRDLEPDVMSRYPSGGLDGKVSSILSAIKSSHPSPLIYGRVGPTSDDQIPFCWSSLSEDYVHNGHPDCFEFNWSLLA